jgi:hypothetical protein
MTERMKRTARSTKARRLVLLGVLGGFVAVALVAAGALAAAGPPAPSLTGQPANPSNVTSANFAFTDSQAGVTLNCKLDSGAFQACTSPKAYTGLAAGSHTFQVQALAGGKASGTTSFTWTVDLTPPAVTISFPANSGSYSTATWNAGCATNVGVCGSATDANGVASGSASILQQSSGRYWNGSSFASATEVFHPATPTGGSGTSFSGYVPLPAPPSGTYVVHARATDKAGNTTPAGSQAAATFTIDSTPPPQPTITTSTASPTNQATASFSFSDAEAGVSFLCKLDGAAFASCTSPKSYSGLAGGAHSFQVEAKDAAGNVSAPASFAWTVDLTPPPAPSLTSTPSSPSNQSSASFSFSDSESGVSFLCKLDSGAYAPCTSPQPYPGLGAGSHTFKVEAKDAAGNLSTESAFTWTVDLTPPPPPSISAHPANPTAQTAANFSFGDGESGVAFGCQLDVGVPAPCTSPKAYATLGDGSHTFTVYAKDAAGNQSPGTGFTWTVDTTPPTPPTITAYPASPTNATGASFSFTGEAGATFLCSLDGSSFSSCASPKSYSGIAAGSHTFRVEARDALGNTGSPASYAWTVDLTAPTVSSLDRADASPTNAGPLHWTVTVSEPVTGIGAGNFGLVTSGLGGSAPTISSATPVGAAPTATWTVTVSTTGTTGTNTGSIQLNLTAKSPIADAAGNALAGTPPFAGQAYTFDTTPPAAPAITNSPPQLPGWTTTTSASFSFTGDSGVTFLCSTNSTSQASFTACSSPKSYSGVAQGPNTFYVEARDAAGNLSAQASRQWRVDTIAPPTPAFTQTPPNPNSTATSNFDWTPHLPAADVDHYECSKENGSFAPCGPPPYAYAVGTTNNGQHQFAVRAVDAAGNVSGSLSYSWKVAAGSIQDFTIDGNATGLLYPGGVARPIAITLHNPNNLPIYVSALTVSATVDTPRGCSHGDLVITQANLATATQSPNAIVIPANGTVTLPAQDVAAPTIRLLDNGHDQTPSCAGQTFSLGYSGSAHS